MRVLVFALLLLFALCVIFALLLMLTTGRPRYIVRVGFILVAVLCLWLHHRQKQR